MDVTHSTPDELMDVVDGVRSIGALPHLADCAACRAQLDELRATIREVAAIGVPEPPSHYWRQLSEHVRDGVGLEQGRTGWRRWLGFSGPWQMVWPAAAAAALVLVVLVAPRGRFERRPPSVPTGALVPDRATVAWPPSGTRQPERVDAASTSDAAAAGDSVDESLVAFMQNVSADMDVETAGASLRPDVSVADAAVEELSDDERVEMRRLIQEAMRASGA
jgi:hypothetical protein